MDDSHKEIDSMQNTGEKGRAPSTDEISDSDLEWKQFIKQEVDRVENQEEESSKKELSLGAFVQYLPVEELVSTIADVVIQKIDSKNMNEKTKPEKNEPKKTKKKKKRKRRNRENDECI